jgi:hypothetical protein
MRQCKLQQKVILLGTDRAREQEAKQALVVWLQTFVSLLAPVAQLDRATSFYLVGRGFESLREC